MNNYTFLTFDEGLKLIPPDVHSPGMNGTLLELVKRLKISAKDKSKCFVRAEYSYGDFIAQSGKLTEIAESEISKLLCYCRIPLGFLLDNSAEVNSRVGKWRVATTILKKHSLFGVFETLDYLCKLSSNGHSWDVTAGSASLRINYPFKGRTKTNDHFDAARILAKGNTWSCSVLYFTKHLFERIRDKTHEFSEFLLRYGWEQNQTALDFNALFDNKLSHVADACDRGGVSVKALPAFFWFFVKLLLVMKGHRPAYRPVRLVESNHLGPFNDLLTLLEGDASQHSAEAKEYHSPMIFVPSFISDDTTPAYLSICYASPGFHATQLPKTSRKAHEVFADALTKLYQTDRNDEIAALARTFNVTPFNFWDNKPKRDAKKK